jgi:hypothetical protein
LIQDLFEQQRAVLRRDLLDHYEIIATRVADELRPPESIEETVTEDDGTGGRFAAGLKIAVGLLSLLFVAFASFFWIREQSWQDVQAENTSLRSAIEQKNTGVVDRATDVQSRIDEYQSTLSSAYQAALESIEWGVNQASTYAFDELPFGNKRLAVLEAMTGRLLDIDFTGVVRIESHVGDFCMVLIAPERFVLPPRDLMASQCDAIGFDPRESIDLGMRQSVAFANFVNSSSARSQGKIRFEITSQGNAEPAVPYPASLSGTSAERWNEVAATNNRVIVTLYAEPLDLASTE